MASLMLLLEALIQGHHADDIYTCVYNNGSGTDEDDEQNCYGTIVYHVHDAAGGRSVDEVQSTWRIAEICI